VAVIGPQLPGNAAVQYCSAHTHPLAEDGHNQIRRRSFLSRISSALPHYLSEPLLDWRLRFATRRGNLVVRLSQPADALAHTGANPT
jgi:hypothetical protein